MRSEGDDEVVEVVRVGDLLRRQVGTLGAGSVEELYNRVIRATVRRASVIESGAGSFRVTTVSNSPRICVLAKPDTWAASPSVTAIARRCLAGSRES